MAVCCELVNYLFGEDLTLLTMAGVNSSRPKTDQLTWIKHERVGAGTPIFTKESQRSIPKEQKCRTCICTFHHKSLAPTPQGKNNAVPESIRRQLAKLSFDFDLNSDGEVELDNLLDEDVL